MAHRYMVQNWVLLSTTDPGFLRWSLIAACRYLAMGRLGDEYADLAARYKLRQIQSLRRAITNASMSREAVGDAVALAFDEVNHTPSSLRIFVVGMSLQLLSLN